jgi:hypothetical protein
MALRIEVVAGQLLFQAIRCSGGVMKRAIVCFLLLLFCLVAGTAFGQKGCEINLVGTWETASADGTTLLQYRFGPDATLKVLARSGQSTEWKEIASAAYEVDNSKTPMVIRVKAAHKAGIFAQGTTPLDVTAYDDNSLTLAKSGAAPVRWVRADAYRYFLVLVGRSGTFYDSSGPTFPMLIKTGGPQPQVDAVGIYSDEGKRAFGPVPAAMCNEFMKEPRSNADVMLRLEISGAQYERDLKIVRTWVRRAQEEELLYPDPNLDNILLVKQVTEGLNQCGEKIKLYNLDWGLKDTITENNPVSRTPFLYFKELRRLNESLHVSDAKFMERTQPPQSHAGQ